MMILDFRVIKIKIQKPKSKLANFRGRKNIVYPLYIQYFIRLNMCQNQPFFFLLRRLYFQSV